ncbi:hypothetical protein EPUS_05634 [Endocarpon pusillum Z07020]|uniref:Fe2OG dioxygenase domain-containing protein n=1 Tax=Endocarpon pusillum (strain Z07020 / HMAS-L-300199) TaxID=1263415 RepID=U1HEK7_ENDPU|nr:uncharacterized protein EPUS_05634 [Endocarpon pusillum Z07020]ERF68495.1 hypothetical protein EPUS_05634 [Endocarpon pusillum Z07020]
MVSQQHPQTSVERLLAQLDKAMTHYQLTNSFSCGGSLEVRLGTHYSDFTITKKPVMCFRPIVFWCKGSVSKHTTIDCSWTTSRNWENSLDELVQDCSPATFGCDGENIFDEKIRKAGVLDAASFSTNFNPYDFGIVDAVAQELLPGLARAGKQPAVERWGVVAELYKLNVYSAPSGMFKPHVDTPRGRTHFGSLVVALPTDFQGGQLRVAYKGKERAYLDDGSFCRSDINWVAFYSDCEHEVLPVTAGHRITLTYQLYVSECIGGLVQPQLQMPDSKFYPMYRCIKDMLASPTFMKNGGILGFHCVYQYPEKFEGTYFYERYPRTLKGIDAVIFAIFRALELTVHIKPYEAGSIIGGKIADARVRLESLFTEEATCGRLVANEFERFDCGHYVGDEIFEHVKWFNEKPALHPAGEGCLDVAKPTRWIGNETEVDWDYLFRALLVVVPASSDRTLKT